MSMRCGLLSIVAGVCRWGLLWLRVGSHEDNPPSEMRGVLQFELCDLSVTWLPWTPIDHQSWGGSSVKKVRELSRGDLCVLRQ
eukprot:1400832-Amphidinium_carterae.1